VSFFWLVLLALGMLAWAILEGVEHDHKFTIWAFLLFLPGLQLIAAILVALILAVSHRPDKGYQFHQLGKIVVGTLVGTLIGGVLTVVSFIMIVKSM
jgi:hypothetical protein